MNGHLGWTRCLFADCSDLATQDCRGHASVSLATVATDAKRREFTNSAARTTATFMDSAARTSEIAPNSGPAR